MIRLKSVAQLFGILSGFTCIAVFFIARCGPDDRLIFSYVDPYVASSVDQEQLVDMTDVVRMPVLNFSKEYDEQLFALKSEVESLRKQLSLMTEQKLSLLKKLTESKNLTERLSPSAVVEQSKIRAVEYFQFFQTKLKDSEILTGLPQNNEFEVVPYTRFSLNRIYVLEPGLGKRVIEKPIGYKKKEILEILNFALNELNIQRQMNVSQFLITDFIEGLFRTIPSVGTHYELYFRDIDNSAQYRKVITALLYGPITLISKESVLNRDQIIHVILPLAGRVDIFRRFMNNYVHVCLVFDKKVHLTVVYFGTDGLDEVQSIITNISDMYRFSRVRLVTLDETFSRGRGLQVGAQTLHASADILLFMCDVDVVFSVQFLERCRQNAESGRKVYYPIVFSLYNPKVVYALHDLPIPDFEKQLIISKEAGFWRDFGYGMTCQYRSDFLRMKGFDDQTYGWGMEDVYLYRKYIKSDMFVVRATDPGIFHTWHTKDCDPNLSADQYRGCIRSKALNEASHSQLGLLAFKEEIDIHRAFYTTQPPGSHLPVPVPSTVGSN